MSVLTGVQESLLLDTARNLSMNAGAQRVEDFVANALTLNAAQRLILFPNPDPNGNAAKIIGCLTGQRERILGQEGTIPSYVIWNDGVQGPMISGVVEYLQQLLGGSNRLVQRLPHFRAIRQALFQLQRGHYLEALAAAILDTLCKRGAATRGSGDQGIDAIGWHELIPIHQSFLDGELHSEHLPGDRVFVLASSKAAQYVTGSRKLTLINPAFIRELVGGWLIQRSPAGAWNAEGIQLLTPVQLVLATTYRLSAPAKQECRKVGIQVWSTPVLICLVCMAAPDTVFDAQSNYAFQSRSFRQWWLPFHSSRLTPPAAPSP